MASPKPFLYAALAALTVIVLAAVLVFYLLFWPWIASPPASSSAIESRWKAVQAFAAYEQHCKNDPIDMSIVATGDAIDLALISGNPGYPRLERTTLSAEAHAALRGLEDWSKKGGGIVVSPGRSRHGLPLFKLGKLALATTSSLDDPAVASVLHAARALRRCGLFGDAELGFGLSETLTVWLADRGLRPDARFVALRPTRDEAFAAVSRIAVEEYDASRASIIPMHAPVYTLPFIDGEREQAWLKYDAAERLFAINAFGRDPFRMASLFPDDPDALPKSSLVRGSFMFQGINIRKIAICIERYDEALAAP